MKLPPQEVLREVLRYDPDTGELFWRERDVSYFEHTFNPERFCKTWNTKYAVRARKKAERLYGFHENHGRYVP